MHPNVAKIIQIVPPPIAPTYSKGDWKQVESELGTGLPQDFVDFTETYGAVTICHCFWLHAPFYYVGDQAYKPFLGEPIAYKQLLRSRLRELDAVTGGRTNVPYPDFPSPGGLLPIGATDNGDIVCWITDGDPNLWKVFFWSFPGIHTYTCPTNITGFVLGLLTGASPLFPEAMPEEQFSPENRRIDPIV